MEAELPGLWWSMSDKQRQGQRKLVIVCEVTNGRTDDWSLSAWVFILMTYENEAPSGLFLASLWADGLNMEADWKQGRDLEHTELETLDVTSFVFGHM